MSNKEIKDQLQKGNVKFTVDGIISYMRGGKNNEWGNFPRIFRVTEEAESIYVDELLSVDGMNINKWGPTCITLYTFDMLGKKSIGKIKYSDITILK